MDWSLEIFRPREYLNSIYEVDFGGLRNRGYSALILDLDDTLLPRELIEISPVLYSFIEGIKDKGFSICLLSNNLNPERVQKVGKVLDLPVITLAGKPFPFAYQKAFKLLNKTAKESVTIGDQLFMDILGGNLAGIYTIFVKHMTQETSFWRRLMRRAEQFVLSKLDF